MSKLFLGVDAGATKTHAVALDKLGRVLGFGEAGCGSHEVSGFTAAQREIREAMEAALGQARLRVAEITRAAFCLAGVDVPSDYADVPLHMLDPLIGKVPYLLKNDAFGCLRGGTRDPFGVMINCGSGQVAVGRNRSGLEVRVGGYGWDYGDFAGGNVITHAAVAAAVRAEDGRGEPTQLVERLLDLSGQASMEDFLARAYRDDAYVWSLGLPKMVFSASRNGDLVARKIILDVADEMAVTATTLIRRLSMEAEDFDLITAGSVFKGEDPAFLAAIQTKVHATAPGARFRMPLYPPVVGAGLLALEEEGLRADEEVYMNLDKTFSSACGSPH
jgi:N-acetylglucosamine kinase-like BadF-type ATPase